MVIEELSDVHVDFDDLKMKVLDALQLNEDLPASLEFQTSDAKAVLSHIKDSIRYIQAGGGYVTDQSGHLLMIFRKGFWDLPKGKMDPGESISETALREVEEECGVQDLRISSPPFSTFHLYEERGEAILKESVWFRMETHHQELVPQAEEDITQAEWISLPVPITIESRCYASILDVLNHFSEEAQ